MEQQHFHVKDLINVNETQQQTGIVIALYPLRFYLIHFPNLKLFAFGQFVIMFYHILPQVKLYMIIMCGDKYNAIDHQKLLY